MSDAFLAMLLALPRVDAAKRSPDRRWVAFTWANEGHGIQRPANQAVLYRRLADFFDAALSG
jgi:dipeptidyl aminopeptidase/acylaminoacyl peptidase